MFCLRTGREKGNVMRVRLWEMIFLVTHAARQQKIKYKNEYK